MQYITIVRGRLNREPNAARDLHNSIVDSVRPRSEPKGSVGHQAYADVQDPMSFVAVDRWSNLEGLMEFIGDPSVQQELGSMFEGAPDVTILAERDEGWRSF